MVGWTLFRVFEVPSTILIDELSRLAWRNKVASAGKESRWIEFGAGDGKLRKWLPEWMCDQVIHTEPSIEYLQQFRRQNIDTKPVEASIYDLPFDDNSIDGVPGLCGDSCWPRMKITLAESARTIWLLWPICGAGRRSTHILPDSDRTCGFRTGCHFLDGVRSGRIRYPVLSRCCEVIPALRRAT